MRPAKERYSAVKKEVSNKVALQAFIENTGQFATVQPFEVRKIYKTSLMAAFEILEPTWVEMYEAASELLSFMGEYDELYEQQMKLQTALKKADSFLNTHNVQRTNATAPEE